MSPPDKYGRSHQLNIRISPIARDKLEQVAALFNMTPAQYAKAIIYRDLGIFNEPLDQRKRTWKKKSLKEKFDLPDEEANGFDDIPEPEWKDEGE